MKLKIIPSPQTIQPILSGGPGGRRQRRFQPLNAFLLMPIFLLGAFFCSAGVNYKGHPAVGTWKFDADKTRSESMHDIQEGKLAAQPRLRAIMEGAMEQTIQGFDQVLVLRPDGTVRVKMSLLDQDWLWRVKDGEIHFYSTEKPRRLLRSCLKKGTELSCREGDFRLFFQKQ